MNLIKIIWGETLGMFVDDGALALQAVVLIAVITSAVKLLGVPAFWGGVMLLPGCMAVLALSLMRKTRSR